MQRRTFLNAGVVGLAGVAGLAGCTSNNAESDDVVEATVDTRSLWADYIPPDETQVDQMELLAVGPETTWVHGQVTYFTGFTDEDIDGTPRSGDLPIDEVTPEIEFQRMYGGFDLEEEDSVHDDESSGAISDPQYVGSTAIFDQLEAGKAHQLLVTETTDYYGVSAHGRIIDIIE